MSTGEPTTTDEAEAYSRARTARQVLDDHLRLRAEGDLERDIELNYHSEFVLLHLNGVERGHAGMRKSGTRLLEQLPGMRFTVVAAHVQDNYAYLEWRADSRKNVVRDGADSFVIQDGKIVMQTIHYTLEKAPGS